MRENTQWQDEVYYDLRTLYRYIKLYLYNNSNLYNITKDEFLKIDIKDITIEDLGKMNKNDLESYIFFLDNTLENISKRTIMSL